MAKKKQVVPSAAPAPRPQAASAPDWRRRAIPFLFPVLVFLALAGQGARLLAILLTAAVLVLTLGKGPLALFRQRVTPLLLTVLVYGLLCFIGGLRSDFGGQAMVESAKILTALMMFALALFCLEQEGVRLIFRTLTGCCGIFGLISVDGSSLNLLTPAFARVMGLLGAEYDPSTMGYEAGVRVTGVFSNANVSAGLLAFGILLSLYLLRTADGNRRRLAAYFLLGVNSLAFFLSFSLGAMAAFALACLIYLLAEPAESRLELLFLMAGSIVSTVVLAFAAYAFLGREGAVAVIPVLCALVNGGVIWLLHEKLGKALLTKLCGRGKVLGLSLGGLALAAAVYLVLAVNLTGAVSLEAGQELSRAAYLAPGSYTVTAEGTDPAVTVYSQNDAELMMHTRTVLYEGTLSGADFSVPADSKVVWFVFSGEGELSGVTLSDGTSLKLGYKLLPGFAANRLQGLRANQNFIQRLVFFRDGIALWKQSPLLGFGLAAVEGRLTQVQSFYYETKYIHNHFIQVLDELGVVGLVSFGAMLMAALVLLLKQRRRRTMLFSVLAACLTMMIAHSLTEVVWSTAMYQITTFLLFAALILTYGQPMARLSARAAGAVTAAALQVLGLISAALLGSSMLAAGKMVKIQNGTANIGSQQEFLSAMERLILLDAYDDEAYRVNYIGNALQSGSMEYRAKAGQYAEALRASNEYTACSDAANYYYLPTGQLDRYFDASRAAIAQVASNKDAWNNQITLYQEIFSTLSQEDMEDYLAGVLATKDYLQQYSQGRMEEIALTEENQAFLNLAETLRGKSGGDIYAALSPLLG